MRSFILPALGLSAVALVAAGAFAPGATAAGSPSSSVKSASTNGTSTTSASCYAQRDDDNGFGVISQNFEPAFDSFDSMGADDFALTKSCKLKTTGIDGIFFNGSGDGGTFNVTYYKGGAHHPAKVVKQFSGVSFTDDGSGALTIPTAGKLKKGKYWVSAQINLSFSSGGEWMWLTNNTVRGRPAQWQNPGDGLGTGCTTWTDLTTCFPGLGGDLSFSVS